MLYDIWKDRPAHIVPGDNPDLMEFYYVLEGTVILKLDSGDVVLQKGTHFHVYNLKGNIQLETKHGARLLYLSSQPVFEMLSEYYNDLYLLLQQSEDKDICTHHHGLRVQTYSTKICEKLKMSKEIIATLQIASLFHDIGKFYVPDEILNKPGKLTKEEYECIQKHPTDSGIMLKDKFDDKIVDIVTQHHEKIDGSGYPKGLKGNEIYLEAKIIAVADAYDAMTSERAYRTSLSREYAIGELKKYSGIYYEKDIVEALISVLNDGSGLLWAL